MRKPRTLEIRKYLPADRQYVLAIDLSLTSPGFAVLSTKNGKVRIEKIYQSRKDDNRWEFGCRLSAIADVLAEVKQDYEEVNWIVIEQGFNRFITATKILSMCLGVAQYCLWLHYPTINVQFIPPTTVKKYIARNGSDTKQAVRKGLNCWLPDDQVNYKFRTYDDSDAVAIGLAFILSRLAFLPKLREVTYNASDDKELKKKVGKPKKNGEVEY